MNTKLFRNNTNFQLAHFIAGSCHTPDAAHVALVAQREDRLRALEQLQPAALRNQAKRLDIERRLAHDDEVIRLEAQADLLDMENAERSTAPVIEAAQAELAYIESLIAQLQPYRKYAHLSDSECVEACQHEEWACELKHRAENYMLTTGTIPPDQFAAMRRHPDFVTDILPHVQQVHALLAQPDGYQQIQQLPRPDPVVKLLKLSQ